MQFVLTLELGGPMITYGDISSRLLSVANGHLRGVGNKIMPEVGHEGKLYDAEGNPTGDWSIEQ